MGVVDVHKGERHDSPDLTLAPGYSAEVICDDDKGCIEIFAANDVLNAYDDSMHPTFPDGIRLEIDPPQSEMEVAMACWVAKAVSDFHEAMEFTMLDGKRLADPHPAGHEEEMWGWLYARMHALAWEYVRRWPIEG